MEFTPEALESCWTLRVCVRQALPKMTNDEYADMLATLGVPEAHALVNAAYAFYMH